MCLIYIISDKPPSRILLGIFIHSEHLRKLINGCYYPTRLKVFMYRKMWVVIISDTYIT